MDEKKQHRLRVLIAGAGIAGPALAFWLSRLGHSCTVVERHTTLRQGGQQIDLRKQGIEAVRRMGLLDEVRRHVVDEEGVQFVNSAGERQFFFPREEPGSKTQGFSSEFEIMRGDLCQLLYDATKNQTTYRFGIWVEDFENVGDVVNVTLSNGDTEEYDLLVGADGQSSRIRKSLLKDEGGDERCLRHLGAVIAYFPVERTPYDPDIATGYNAPGHKFILTRWHTKEVGQGYLMTMGDEEALYEALKKDPAAQKEALAKIFTGIGWQSERVLAAMKRADDFYAAEMIQVRSKIWHKGRVVLLGDAGYTPSPMTGMGTSSAIVGAYVLAGELSRHKGDVSEALAAYDTTLRPWVEGVQKLNLRVLRIMYPKTKLGIRLVYFVLGLVTKLRLNSLVQSMMMEDGDRWELPKYPDMETV